MSPTGKRRFSVAGEIVDLPVSALGDAVVGDYPRDPGCVGANEGEPWMEVPSDVGRIAGARARGRTDFGRPKPLINSIRG